MKKANQHHIVKKENLSMKINQGILFFFLLLFCAFSFGQDKIKRAYEISPAQKPQKLVLLEFENQSYRGYIITELEHLSEEQNIEIIDKHYLDSLNVQKLMSKLKQQGIEELESCYNKKCGEYTNYHGGGYVSFKIENESIREFRLRDIYPLTKNYKYVETNKVRRNAQMVLTTIFNYIDFSIELSNLMKKLPKGIYTWRPNGTGYYSEIRNKM